MPFSGRTSLAVFVVALSGVIAVDVDESCMGSTCDTQDSQVLLQAKMAVDNAAGLDDDEATELNESELAELSEEERIQEMQACTDDPSLAGVHASDITSKGYAANADGVSSWCTSVMGNPADCSGKLQRWVDGCQKTCGRCGQAADVCEYVKRNNFVFPATMVRFSTLGEAQAACTEQEDCAGVTEDNGIGGKKFSTRSTSQAGHTWNGFHSWEKKCQAGGFTVEAGSCVTTDNGKCVTSNAQGKYGNNERCTIKTPSAGTVEFTKYDTERGWDYMTIDGTQYKHSTPPAMTLTAAKTVSWYSDGSVTRSGFKMCVSAAQELPVFGR